MRIDLTHKLCPQGKVLPSGHWREVSGLLGPLIAFTTDTTTVRSSQRPAMAALLCARAEQHVFASVQCLSTSRESGQRVPVDWRERPRNLHREFSETWRFYYDQSKKCTIIPSAWHKTRMATI